MNSFKFWITEIGQDHFSGSHRSQKKQIFQIRYYQFCALFYVTVFNFTVNIESQTHYNRIIIEKKVNGIEINLYIEIEEVGDHTPHRSSSTKKNFESPMN